MVWCQALFQVPAPHHVTNFWILDDIHDKFDRFFEF